MNYLTAVLIAIAVPLGCLAELTTIKVVSTSNDIRDLGVCEGDCDHDGHCQRGLICFQRNPYEPVPGCTGGKSDKSRTDYCVPLLLVASGTDNPSQLPSSTPTFIPSTMASLTSIPSDTPSLVPSSRPSFDKPSIQSLLPTMISVSTAPSTSPSNIPMTSPTASSPMEIAPRSKIIVFDADPPPTRLPLGLCHGDCDQDSDCAGSLICFQKGPFTEVPGCVGGRSDASKSDFCVSPEALYQSKESNDEEDINYVPGKLTRLQAGLLLSQGLDARVIATTGDLVKYSNGNHSAVPFHGRPDAAAIFADTRPENEGGFIYVSNSEMKEEGAGGVGALTFDSAGQVLDYKMILTGSTMNCGGGKTPWGSWVSCEEKGNRRGNAFQVDPLGVQQGEKMTMGNEGGRWESFAHNARPGATPQFFMTEDHPKGALVRFTPTGANWTNPWSMLHESGTKDYLELYDNGTFGWNPNRNAAMRNAKKHYPDTEGIDVRGTTLFFVSKSRKMLYKLDLDNQVWTQSSTQSGLFDGQPDQIKRLLNAESDLLYFTEEGGNSAGIHARDNQARFYTVLESATYPGETTGLAFSPDAKFMFVAYQDVGKVLCIWRMDGGAFGAQQLDVKFHEDN